MRWLFLLCLTGCSGHNLMLASNAALMVDWSQTRSIVGSQYHEHNRILGRNPSQGDVNTYFATAILLNTALYFIIDYIVDEPEKVKTYWYGGLTLMETAVIANNARIGVGFD